MPYNVALHNCKQKDKKYNLKDILETKIQPRTQMEIHEMQKNIRKRNKERAEREKIKGFCDGLKLDSLPSELKAYLPNKPCKEMTQREYDYLYQVLYNLRDTKEFKDYFKSLIKYNIPNNYLPNGVKKNYFFPE